MEVNPNPASIESFIQRPGEYLAQIRLQKQIDLEQISKELAIPLKSLQALEKDDYQVLPEATFIRGFLRAYARYLQVDAQPLIDGFNQLYPQKTGRLAEKSLTDSPLKIKGKLAGSKKGLSIAWFKWVGYLLAIGVVIALLMMFVQKIKSNKDTEENQATNVEVIDLAGKKSTPTQTQPVKNNTAQTGERLKLEFKRPTSVLIEDADGKILASGRQASTLELTGKAPFKIRIDDATVATLRLNDENIDLSKRMVNGKVDFRLAR